MKFSTFKKASLWLTAIFFVAFFENGYIAMLLPYSSIKETKYVSPTIEFDELNGFYYVLLKKPILIYGQPSDTWRKCNKLNQSLQGRLKRVPGWPDSGPYLVLINAVGQGVYKAYIRHESERPILFVHGYADTGGALPTEEEVRVCADPADGG